MRKVAAPPSRPGPPRVAAPLPERAGTTGSAVDGVRRLPPVSSPASALPRHALVLALQGTVGNARVARLLAADGPPPVQRWGLGGLLGWRARWSSADRRMIDAAVQRVGIIEEYQAARVEPAVDALSADDYKAFRGLLTKAGSNTERAFLSKALAAGRTVAEIATFAATIRGRSDRWLLRNLNLVAVRTRTNARGRGVVQQFGNSCGPTSVQIVRGQYDPVYALNIRSGGDVTTASDDAATDPAACPNPDMAAEQSGMLTGPNANPATDRSNPMGGAWVEGHLNALSARTGITYAFNLIPGGISMDDAIDTLNTNLDRGVHMPLVVGGSAGDTAHYVMAIRRRGRQYMIHDPWTGETVWRSAHALRNGRMRLPSGHRVFVGIDVPTLAPVPARRRR